MEIKYANTNEYLDSVERWANEQCRNEVLSVLRELRYLRSIISSSPMVLVAYEEGTENNGVVIMPDGAIKETRFRRVRMVDDDPDHRDHGATSRTTNDDTQNQE